MGASSKNQKTQPWSRMMLLVRGRVTFQQANLRTRTWRFSPAHNGPGLHWEPPPPSPPLTSSSLSQKHTHTHTHTHNEHRACFSSAFHCFLETLSLSSPPSPATFSRHLHTPGSSISSVTSPGQTDLMILLAQPYLYRKCPRATDSTPSWGTSSGLLWWLRW